MILSRQSLRLINAANDHTITELTQDDFHYLEALVDSEVGDEALVRKLGLFAAWLDGKEKALMLQVEMEATLR